MGTFKKEQFDAILGHISNDDDYKTAFYAFESLNDSVPLEDFIKDTWLKLDINTKDVLKAMADRLEKKQSDFKNLAEDYKRLEENVRKKISDAVMGVFVDHVNECLQHCNAERNNTGKIVDANVKLNELATIYGLRLEVSDTLYRTIQNVLYNPPF